jgi:hypothetical protein
MLPVFVHHELNEKPQTGGAPNQAYVKTCISQAKKYNSEVVLFGDESNKSYSEKWVDVSNFTSAKWTEFLETFENFSTYPDSWAKGIFKRFFIIEEYMNTNNIEKCVILDSDVLVWCDFERLDLIKNYDVALEIPEDQKLHALPFDNLYRWAACCGVGVMTRSAISDFTDFCIQTYKTNKPLLLEKWNLHCKYNLAGGICEMSLLYLWIKERQKQYNILNFGKVKNDVAPCIVVNGGTKQYEISNQFATMRNSALQECLQIKFKGQYPYIYDVENHTYIKVLTIHFGGKSKIFMDNFANEKTYFGLVLLDWYYWVLRGKASCVKNAILKSLKKHK